MTSKDESTDVRLDISKYEGHTPGPWWMPSMELRGSSQPVVKMATFKREPSLADRILIADAPLLLEGVKRLQRKLMLAESALGEIRAYHESGQGNLGEIIEHYQENEQVEMPNAFDEDDA